MEQLILQSVRLIWTYFTIPLLLAVSCFYTFYLGGVQFKFLKMIRALTTKSENRSTVTPMQSLFMALAAKVGVGSLAGVALAISIGGPGSIFWMRISTFLTTAASFAESTLAQIFKRRDQGRFIGGPAFYIRYGLNNKWIAALYAIIILLTYTFGFSAVQTNTIAASFESTLQMAPFVTGILLSVVTALILLGGAAGITQLVSKLVPIIAFFYISMGLFALFTHLDFVGTFFQTIIADAFNVSSLLGGGLMVGLQRGIFSNEAGLGSGAHAASMTDSERPTQQGYIQAFGVYLTTLVVITITAFMLMVTGAPSMAGQLGNGIQLTQYAMNSLFGPLGNYLLTLSIFFFGFSTIPTAYFYGESNIRFLTKKPEAIWVLRILVVVTVFVSSITSSTFLWSLVDLGTGTTATINLIALIGLASQVKRALNFEKTHQNLSSCKNS